MHRLILKAEKGQVCDHINHNGLDNRRKNLRLCTNSQNFGNQRKRPNKSSIYKGVCFYKRDSKWQVGIECNYKKYYLGRFDNEIEAAKVYDKKAAELFGEFAYTNFGGQNEP